MKLTVEQLRAGDKIKCADGSCILILNITGKGDNLHFHVEIDGDESDMNMVELVKRALISKEAILTHNCQQRLICGQLGSIASRMALDDNQATTIDGKHKGAGMVKAQGVVSYIQYYFEEQKWIEKWFTKRGLTSKGWEKGEDPNEPIKPDDIDLGEDEDISISKSKTVMEFQGIHKEVDNTKDQKFEEV